MHDAITVKVRARIYDWGNGWKIAGEGDPVAQVREVDVDLAITGDSRQGYFLVASPAGSFTADFSYASREEALKGAQALFGVSPDAWRPAKNG